MCKALTEAQYARITHVFPVQRGNVALSNLQVLNALLYIAVRGSVQNSARYPRQAGGMTGVASAGAAGAWGAGVRAARRGAALNVGLPYSKLPTR